MILLAIVPQSIKSELISTTPKEREREREREREAIITIRFFQRGKN